MDAVGRKIETEEFDGDEIVLLGVAAVTSLMALPLRSSFFIIFSFREIRSLRAFDEP